MIKLTTHQSLYINKDAEKWINHLLGFGDKQYKQGTGFLCSGDEFCCLGVAEDLQGQDFIVVGRGETDDVRLYADGEYGGRVDEVLTRGTRVALGLINTDGDTGSNEFWVEINGESVPYSNIAHANDGGADFEELAISMLMKPEIFFVPVADQKAYK